LALSCGSFRLIFAQGCRLGGFTAALVCDALQMAIGRRKRPHGVIAHSDRGRQYCLQQYQQLLKENGFICSMSKKGDC